MTTPCYSILLAVLSLACLSSFACAEEQSALPALDDNDSDGFARHARQFYRFGRALAPLWNNVEDSLVGKNHLLRWSAYPVAPEDDAFSRHSRQFYRFGRAYPPYQDKRFLRFGRSQPLDLDDYLQPLYRRRRALETKASEHLLQRSKRSADLNQQTTVHGVGKDLHKREVSNDGLNINDPLSNSIILGNDLQKKFMRFGKRFMRFGRGDEDEIYEKRFMRFGKSFGDDDNVDKRFMRFGKRYPRIRSEDETDDNEEKRFMRFGKNGNEDADTEKRFMRFGKRFMRFGKRFMRFGRGDTEDESENLNDTTDKRFMRFGRRTTRHAHISASSSSDAAATAS